LTSHKKNAQTQEMQMKLHIYWGTKAIEIVGKLMGLEKCMQITGKHILET
jgi:hypothetical protein